MKKLNPKYQLLKNALDAAKEGRPKDMRNYIQGARGVASLPLPEVVVAKIIGKLYQLYPPDYFKEGEDGNMRLKMVPRGIYPDGTPREKIIRSEIQMIRETYQELAQKIPGLPVPSDQRIRELYRI